MRRKGMGAGKGKGYKNIIKGYDKKVHSDSSKGRKQPQKVNIPYYKTDSYKQELIKSINKNIIKKDRQLERIDDSIIKREIWMLKIPNWKLDQNSLELIFKSDNTGLFVSAHHERKPKKINEKFGKLFIKSWDVLVWDLKTKKDLIRKTFDTKNKALNYSKKYMTFHSQDDSDLSFGIHESDEFQVG